MAGVVGTKTPKHLQEECSATINNILGGACVSMFCFLGFDSFSFCSLCLTCENKTKIVPFYSTTLGKAQQHVYCGVAKDVFVNMVERTQTHTWCQPKTHHNLITEPLFSPDPRALLQLKNPPNHPTDDKCMRVPSRVFVCACVWPAKGSGQRTWNICPCTGKQRVIRTYPITNNISNNKF